MPGCDLLLATSGSIQRRGVRAPVSQADLSPLRETLSHLGETARVATW